jgi:superfamily I DNA and RNA helicase
MEINVASRTLASDPAAEQLISHLRGNENELGLDEAELYYDFPLFRDTEGSVVVSQVLLVSRQHGVIAFGTSSATSHENVEQELQKIAENLDQVFVLLYSRLIRNKSLRKSQKELLFPTAALLFAPLITDLPFGGLAETPPILTVGQLDRQVNQLRSQPMPADVYAELVATVEGAKGLIRRRPRDVDNANPQSKGNLANKIESQIASFDQRQKHGSMVELDGLQRIRGLAGSGKTVVLAMKAALTHLRDPDALILYTFSTKSLYQHIQRLVTRFYRQYDDRDPDWTRLKIMHAWGGRTTPGVYYDACVASGIDPMRYQDAITRGKDAFDVAVSKLLQTASISPQYDYVFIDEGQDFPASFIRLCVALAKNSRLVFAYDELQTIFQITVPTLQEIVGTNGNGGNGKPVEFSEDVTLYKCYRNPREIIVCAHALGFGIYSSRIVQMLENREHWVDVGYKVLKGDFTEGSSTVIERPLENSLPTISENQTPDQIVQALSFDTFAEEIDYVAASIQRDIQEGLRPEDVLVVAVDDRNARNYLSLLAEKLSAFDLDVNNIHADPYGVKDFQKEGRVTLSTVHKAKGNEAFMVYVIGVDALFKTYAGPRERNMLFTAMTRAKGWVRVSGIGNSAEACKGEIAKALENFPNLAFTYPSKQQLKVMKRDLADKARRKQRMERMLDEVLSEMSPDEIERFMEQRSIKKGLPKE